MRLGGFFYLQIVEIRQLLEVRAQHVRVKRFGKAVPAVRLGIVFPPQCHEHVDIGCIPCAAPRDPALGLRPFKGIQRGRVVALRDP